MVRVGLYYFFYPALRFSSTVEKRCDLSISYLVIMTLGETLNEWRLEVKVLTLSATKKR